MNSQSGILGEKHHRNSGRGYKKGIYGNCQFSGTLYMEGVLRIQISLMIPSDVCFCDFAFHFVP